MARIEKQIIERVIDASQIEEVVGDFVDLKKKGVRYLGLCPFHDDRHLGSFVVYPRKQCYKCFVCGAKGGVVEFLMKHERLSYPDAIRWLGKKYNIETDMTDFNYTPPQPRPLPEPLPMLVLPMSMVKARETTTGNKLVEWIETGVKWDVVQRERVAEVLRDYHIGTARNGMTIFWQIDTEGKVRTGKMMLYKADGHRDKETRYNFDFIHSALFRDQRHPEYDETKQELEQCLFGLHLLNAYKRKDVEQTVKIVESEKTAVLMAIAYGNHTKQVWMACGGLENLTRARLQPLIDQRRNIIVYPDRDGVEKWRIKCEQLHYDRIMVDDVPVTKWWRECDGPKADIADVVIRITNERRELTDIEEVKREMPEAEGLIEKMNLTITKDD